MQGGRAAFLDCDPALIPAPGRYLQAHEEGSESPLSTQLFAARIDAHGFLAAPPIPNAWGPGTVVNVRGPLGNGFGLPPTARRVALIAFNSAAARLLPIAESALKQAAAVSLLTGESSSGLPLELEVHPLKALNEILRWCDYAAIDVEAASLGAFRQALGGSAARAPHGTAQVLVETWMPCGAIAECGVCAIRTAEGPRLVCADGPVFELSLLLTER